MYGETPIASYTAVLVNPVVEKKVCSTLEVRLSELVTFYYIFSHIYFPASGQQAVVAGFVPSPIAFITMDEVTLTLSLTHKKHRSECLFPPHPGSCLQF